MNYQKEDMYSSLTLVLAFCEGSHNSPQNKFSSFLTLYIVPHIPKASGICEKKFQRFSLKNLWAKNEKSMKKLSPTFKSSLGSWYSKRPSWSHDYRVFNDLENAASYQEIFTNLWNEKNRKIANISCCDEMKWNEMKWNEIK